MRAGGMDRRVEIQHVTRAEDPAGQATETWATVARVWAGVLPLTATERALRPMTRAEETRRFRLRPNSHYKLDPANFRILFEGKAWDIEGISELPRHEGYELTATARVG